MDELPGRQKSIRGAYLPSAGKTGSCGGPGLERVVEQDVHLGLTLVWSEAFRLLCETVFLIPHDKLMLVIAVNAALARSSEQVNLEVLCDRRVGSGRAGLQSFLRT